MKIIEQYNPETWIHRFTCEKCKAVCEADYTDVKYLYSKAEGCHPPSELYYLTCPLCLEQEYLPQDLPPIIKIKSKEKHNSRTLNYFDR